MCNTHPSATQANKHFHRTPVTAANLGRMWHRQDEVGNRLLEHEEKLAHMRGNGFAFLVRDDEGRAYLAEASFVHSTRSWKIHHFPVNSFEQISQLPVVVPQRAA
ncbi:MAG: hypothetical protein AAB920_01865 [Patescibacteria group bacterium]